MQKIIKKISSIGFLSAALMAFGHSAFAQITIDVPSSCNVVVAGTGGSTGFGGTVGSGGIVVMPDPFKQASPAGDFVLDPDGNTITGWSLAGDLSVYTANTPPTAPTQSAGGVTTVNIQSYNKNLRPSEAASPSTSTLARSKGRVSIQYESEGCGPNSISFEIYKTYDNTSGIGSEYVPPIIGPSCWLPDSIYTYSVDHVASDNVLEAIGVDKYYWYVADVNGKDVRSLQAYNSADNSSITLATPSSIDAPYTITCCYGRANNWDSDLGSGPGSHTTCVSLIIGGQPTAPDFVTEVPPCLETGLTSFGAEVIPEAGYTYTWSASNASWKLTTSGAQGEVLNVSSLTNDPGEIKLKIAFGDCAPSEFIYPVNRKFVEPLQIQGESCVAAGTTHRYTLPDGALNNASVWTIPQQPDVAVDWIQQNYNGAGSAIDLTIPTGTPAGAYTISVKSATTDCADGILYFTVNVQPEKPEIISGNTCVVRNGGSTESYTSTVPAGVTTFSWQNPEGWSCSACTTSTAVMQPAGGATGPVSMTVTALGANNCNAISDPLYINYKPVAPNTITAPSCWNYRVDGSSTLLVNNAPSSSFFGSYTVSSNPSTLLTGYSVNSTTGAITLNTSKDAPASTYLISIAHTTANCSSSTVKNFVVSFGGNGANLSANYDPDPVGSDTYFAFGVSGAPTYQWYKDETVIPGQTGFSLGLSGGTPTFDSVCVHVTRTGCTTRKCAEAGTHANARVAFASPDESAEIAVFPNPNNGDFTVNIPKYNTSATLHLIDANGSEVSTYTLKVGKNRISNNKVASGTYHVVLEIDGKTTVHQVQVLK